MECIQYLRIKSKKDHYEKIKSSQDHSLFIPIHKAFLFFPKALITITFSPS